MLNSMGEIWKVIRDYDDYEVSNLGNVRKRYTKSQCYLSLKDGYPRAYLKNKNIGCKGKYECVHRLVAIAFIENINSDNIYINHKDENRANNNVSNLEWCTAQYNRTYGNCSKKLSKRISKPILVTDVRSDISYIFKSQRVFAKHLKCSESAVSMALRSSKLFKCYKLRDVTEKEKQYIIESGKDIVKVI